MKNPHLWKPSKYVLSRGRLRASRDPREVGAASRLVADLAAGVYARYLQEHAGGHLLDLGCGKVPLYGVYRDRVADCTCVDWPGTRHRSEHLDRQCDLTRQLPFDDDRFDTILLSDVLEHIPNPEQLWREMARVLKPGGKLLLGAPFLCWVHEAPHDYYRYSEFALRRFAEGVGLRVLALEPSGGLPAVLADLIAKGVVRLPGFGRPLASLVQALAHLLMLTAWGRRASRKSATVFPSAYFMVAQKMSSRTTLT